MRLLGSGWSEQGGADVWAQLGALLGADVGEVLALLDGASS
jgi:hypothetical protein